MLAKVDKDNKIQMQLINYHKNKVSTNIQMLTLFISSLIITN
jgi:hypothetical protein